MTSLHDLRAIKLNEIKKRVNCEIRTLEGVMLSHQQWFHKSLNALETIITSDNASDEYAAAQSLLARKNMLVKHYHQVLKPKIERMTIEELKSFDTEDDLWMNLDVA